VISIRRSFLLPAALLLAPVMGRAQFQPVAPQAVPPPPAQTGAGAQLVAPPTVGFVPPAVNNGWGYYGNPYVYSPAGAYLSGLADLTNASGQYLQQVQQSRILQNQADSGKLELRREIWQQEAWERKNTPTAEQMRAYEAKIDLQRARSNPPNNYIWSGDAMNTLMVDIQRAHAAGVFGPPVPVNPDTLRRISVTDGASSRGEIAVLSEGGGKLRWPFVLRKKAFEKDRQKIDQLAATAVTQARSDAVEPETVDALQRSASNLRDQVSRMSRKDELTPTEAIQARRYLTQLDGAFRTLKDPNVANFFNGKWAPHGNTIGEVINNMVNQGLRFAPAIEGNETAYKAFFNDLVTYDLRLASMAAR
jgi:hypothetical protein